MDLFGLLSGTPAIVARVAAQMPAALVRVRSGPFGLVEHAWHMADLEREFGERIRRLLGEDEPFLPDFDGERVAKERQYLALDLGAGVAAFASAREETVRRLSGLSLEAWTRRGRQQGVGTVSLAEMPGRIFDHDRAHLNEIADLLSDLMPAHPMIGELRGLAQDGPKSSKAA
jgi:DinB superfamily